MKKIYCLLAILLLNTILFSQNEASNWYFGYGAGIKFDIALNTSGSIDDGQLHTFEGCTSFSDEYGNLLFYTDGRIIRNSNHNVMLNGSGLLGDPSSSQSAIIVPKPEDDTIYYVFTVDNNLNNTNFGLNYSIVDMTLDGGLGAVTNKNINLLSSSTEKLSAVFKDCITKSIWVVTMASLNGDVVDSYDTYHAFEVSSAGVNPVSVKSQFTFNNPITDARGYLKFSPDGKKMVSASVQRDALYLFNFNSFTGIVTNQQQLFVDSSNDRPYGVEFSQNSQFLYVNTYNDYKVSGTENDDYNPENHFAALFQYDITASDIESTEYKIDERQLYRGALQLGPDGKIYRALCTAYAIGLPYLGVINNPNEPGEACNYVHNGINLTPNLSAQGLPQYVQLPINTPIDIIRNGFETANLVLCEGDRYILKGENIPGATYTWTFEQNILPENDFDLIITQSGHYQLFIEPNNGECAIEGQAFVTFQENPIINNITLLQCDQDGIEDGLTLFNLKQAYKNIVSDVTDMNIQFYTNSSDAENNVNSINPNSYSNISNPEILYLRVTNELTGCFSLGQITLDVSLTNSQNSELIACDDDGVEDGISRFVLNDATASLIDGLPSGLDISYYQTYEDALLETSKLEATYVNKTPYSDTIFSRAENANNCYGISELKLTVEKLPEVESELITYYCLNNYPQTITLKPDILNIDANNYTYNWSTDETSYAIQINEPGIYTVNVGNANGCFKEKRIIVEAANIASVESINVIDASQNNIITVLASGEGQYDYALFNSDGTIYTNYQPSNIFENVKPGIYTVNIRDVENNCGIIQDLVSVIGFPKYFTPNNDGINDTWQVYGVSDIFQPNTIIYIYNRYGKLVKQLSPTSKGWDGKFNGELLPNNDYWFAVELQDGRIFKNHFSLKR
ncbi:T9SS type B sorting domain-containing protein [Yeosuana sp. MJ-SS3]|uniref:T9SS type B sorting domain-containing protein n=1 Tax=Gilvirhabdus luticola TaxID=3079858 RepID=A0ABU3U6S1_9FLAO|nr:T9SS type B sorting domain-containing protein [Yeosuana sp. MJ-SS3]MDU8886098.1 T9SS type B sorting domain-containing protein [Yeosuana sp. MJ-SS3]